MGGGPRAPCWGRTHGFDGFGGPLADGLTTRILTAPDLGRARILTAPAPAF